MAARIGRKPTRIRQMSCRARPQPGWLSSRGGGGGGSSSRRCRPLRYPACGVRAAAARLRVAHRLLLRARRPSFHRASRGLAGSARRAFRLMCLLDTFRTPSPSSHVPHSYGPHSCSVRVATQSRFSSRLDLRQTRSFTFVYPRRFKRAPRRKSTLSHRHVCAQLGHLGRLCCRHRQRHATPARCLTWQASPWKPSVQQQ